MIIVFFAGLIIMVSGGPIGEASNIAYINLICNTVGGILMGTSVYFLLENEKKKKNELKLLVEKLAGKEEHENEISVLKTIEKVLQEYGEILSSMEEKQKKIISDICDNREIKDSIETINTSINTHFCSLEKEIANKDGKLFEAKMKKIDNLIECVEHLSANHSVSIQNLLNAVETVEKSIKDESMKLHNAIDTFHIDNTEYMRQENIAFSKVIDNTASVLKKLQIQANQLDKTDADIVDALKSIDQRIEGINILPREMNESVETLISKFGKTVESIQSDYKNLTEDLVDQERNRTKKFTSIMTEIRDTVDESNEEMAEEIKKLADQYAAFEKIISAIVDQMNHMAEEDIRVMKGFLNG